MRHSLLAAVLPVYLGVRHIRLAFKSKDGHFYDVANGMQASFTWLTLYGLLSSLAQSQHHPQVKPCFTLLAAGPFLAVGETAHFCQHRQSRDVHLAGASAMSLLDQAQLFLSCRERHSSTVRTRCR